MGARSRDPREAAAPRAREGRGGEDEPGRIPRWGTEGHRGADLAAQGKDLAWARQNGWGPKVHGQGTVVGWSWAPTFP